MVFLGEPDWSSFSSKGKEDARGGVTYAPANSEQRDNTLDRTAFGGRATHYGPDGQVQQSSGQDAAQRYTSLGQAAAQRGAYQNDWAQSNQSRGQQGTALGYMQNAAAGGAPSQAQMLGRNMIDQSLQAQMAGAASARGGSLAQAAAMRQAAGQAGAQQAQGMNQLSALRAQEMAQARGDYFGAASGMRGQDIGQQGMNMQSELSQRQLNQQGQQFYDQMGWNTQRADQEAAMHQAQIDSAEYMKQKEVNQHSEDRNTGVVSSVIGGIGSALGFSDARTKNVVPMGSMQSPMAQLGGQPGGLGGALGGMNRGGMMMMSDARAKKEAFELGAAYADAHHAGVEMKAPDYAKSAPVRNPAAGPVADPKVEEAHAARVAAQSKLPMVPAQPSLAQVAAPAPIPGARPASLAGAVRMVPAMPMVSDERAKNFDADRDSYTVDADEYLESKFPKAGYDRPDGVTTNTTKAERKRIQDNAGRDADAMMAGFGASLARGPSTQDALARAARSMEPAAYTYKPEFVEPGHDPNEVYVGPKDAKKMEKDAVAGTAVDVDPATGMRMLDGGKLLRLNSAIISNQQRQLDSLAAAVAKRGRRS